VSTGPSAKEAGYRAVELGTPPKHFDPWQRRQVDEVREFLNGARITPISMHAPFGGLLDLAELNPRHRHAAIGGILQAVSVLRELGGALVVVHPSDIPRSPEDSGKRLDASATALATLAESCGRMNVRLAIESPLPHLVGGNPEEFRWILQRVDGSAGVCLDTSHTSLGGHWSEFLKVAGSRLIHVHACDNRGQHDDHLAPGEGVIDWSAIVESLRGAGYDGWIVLELACPEMGDRLARIREAAELLFA
jgi:sugar phosphate isomerase/epimerase